MFNLPFRRSKIWLQLLIIISGAACATAPNAGPVQKEPQSLEPTVSIVDITEDRETFLRNKLKASGIRSSALLNLVSSATAAEDDKRLALNILGFMGKSDYSAHYSERALRKSREFMKKNSQSLFLAEKRFGIPREVLTALLWVETQFGVFTGRFPIVESFLVLATADHPSIQRMLIRQGLERRDQDPELRARYPSRTEFENKILDRTRTKSLWAIEQLGAIQQLHRSGHPKISKYLGSFAGAFGVPQFIPSTYRDLAIAKAKNQRPNLYRMPDVIFSVANFLKSKGWNNSEPQAQSDALFEYNRIRDYGAVILKIAGELKAREPATTSKKPTGSAPSTRP